MKLIIRPIDLSNPRDFEFIARWDNDLNLRHLIMPIKRPEQAQKLFSVEELFANQLKEVDPARFGKKVYRYLVLYGETPIGSASLMMDPPHRMTEAESVAWLSIVIGEEDYWHRGFGTEILQFLESIAKSEKADLAEIGVFEFNHRSLNFFKKQGFQEIGRIAQFTYWNDQWWSDIRLIKKMD